MMNRKSLQRRLDDAWEVIDRVICDRDELRSKLDKLEAALACKDQPKRMSTAEGLNIFYKELRPVLGPDAATRIVVDAAAYVIREVGLCLGSQA